MDIEYKGLFLDKLNPQNVLSIRELSLYFKFIDAETNSFEYLKSIEQVRTDYMLKINDEVDLYIEMTKCKILNEVKKFFKTNKLIEATKEDYYKNTEKSINGIEIKFLCNGDRQVLFPRVN